MGIIGGGAVIGCVSAKLARVPAVGMIDTPLDTKVCTRLNQCIVLPEAQLFKEEILPYIWDRYYKVDKNFNRSVNSTGLGLAIAKAILEAHNARYGVESSKNFRS